MTGNLQKLEQPNEKMFSVIRKHQMTLLRYVTLRLANIRASASVLCCQQCVITIISYASVYVNIYIYFIHINICYIYNSDVTRKNKNARLEQIAVEEILFLV